MFAFLMKNFSSSITTKIRSERSMAISQCVVVRGTTSMNDRKGVSVKTKVMNKDIMVVQKIVLFEYKPSLNIESLLRALKIW